MEEKIILVFELKDEEYEEIDIENSITLYSILDTEKILFIVDSINAKVWIWEGKNTSTKMKFISTQLAQEIRDKYGLTYTLASIDEDSEPELFIKLLGLEEELSTG